MHVCTHFDSCLMHSQFYTASKVEVSGYSGAFDIESFPHPPGAFADNIKFRLYQITSVCMAMHDRGFDPALWWGI